MLGDWFLFCNSGPRLAKKEVDGWAGQGFPRHFWAVSSTDLVLPEKNGNGHAVVINKWIVWALQGRVLAVQGGAGRGRGTMPASLEGKQ